MEPWSISGQSWSISQWIEIAPKTNWKVCILKAADPFSQPMLKPMEKHGNHGKSWKLDHFWPPKMQEIMENVYLEAQSRSILNGSRFPPFPRSMLKPMEKQWNKNRHRRGVARGATTASSRGGPGGDEWNCGAWSSAVPPHSTESAVPPHSTEDPMILGRIQQ